MPTRKQLDLSTFDDRLLDGLSFCKKAYALLDQVRSEPKGIADLRLRRTKTVKRLVEELIPLARYVQARYREGRRIKVRWRSGSQPYDAILSSSGWLVETEMYPKLLHVEVTTCGHQNEYLTRHLLHEGRVAFSAKGTSRNKHGEIITKPHVYMNHERENDLAAQIIERLGRKSSKRYPRGTVLIVNCVVDGLMEASEWNIALRQVRDAKAHLAFPEVFLIDLKQSHSTTLYGQTS